MRLGLRSHLFVSSLSVFSSAGYRYPALTLGIANICSGLIRDHGGIPPQADIDHAWDSICTDEYEWAKGLALVENAGEGPSEKNGKGGKLGSCRVHVAMRYCGSPPDDALKMLSSRMIIIVHTDDFVLPHQPADLAQLMKPWGAKIVTNPGPHCELTEPEYDTIAAFLRTITATEPDPQPLRRCC